MLNRAAKRRYNLIGPSADRAADQGLAAAEWYHPEVPRKRMKELMKRKDGPALRDTALWLSLLVAFGFGGGYFWGSWLCVPFFACYGVLYASASDSRWHETGHGTAFRTPWLNDTLYQLSSFMNKKEPTYWRWSHARHHTDTMIVGRDPEFVVMRPPDAAKVLLNLLAIPDTISTAVSVTRHGFRHLTAEEKTFIPEMERSKIFWEARAWIAVYALVVAAAIHFNTFLPVMYVGLPTIYGRWLLTLFGIMQHTGLAENVLDHRLNTRTVYMNRLFRFLYWNMNYHLEHHMFPMVPYHALPELHAEIRGDLPKPYSSTFSAYREIVPVLWRQLRDPDHYVRRKLPPLAQPFRPELHQAVFEV
jgi:fatty acid desaturase